MKFMKLGYKSDTFYIAEAVRYVSSEVSSDLVIQVKGYRYLLHKFPLFSKCAYLRKLYSEAPESSPQPHLLQLYEFLGGLEAFELCVKFCYGIRMTLSARNIVAVMCAAEYLQMTEEAETGNLINKLNIFFNSCVLNGWKDAIVSLQSTEKIPMWPEKLGITSKCIDTVSAKILAHPTQANMFHKDLRKVSSNETSSETRTDKNTPNSTQVKAWWTEDLSDLSLDLFRRVVIVIKSAGSIPPSLIGEALKAYSSKWLPRITKCSPDKNKELQHMKSSRHILILETIISLLPAETGSVSCRFLCNLLKAVNILNASSSSKMKLAGRIGDQLEEAHASDLLIPSPAQHSYMMYDVDTVKIILDKFVMQVRSPSISPHLMEDRIDRRGSRSADTINYECPETREKSLEAFHVSKLKVAKVVDKYLQEIAKDVNLPVCKFLDVAESVPDIARPDHDALYKAIDAYLEAHPDLEKSERKKICRVLNFRRLSIEVGMRAAQNEKLPLRVVVQLLFMEHSKTVLTSSNGGHCQENVPTIFEANVATAEDRWSRTRLKSPRPDYESNGVTLKQDDHEREETDGMIKSCMLKNLCVIRGRPKKMLSRLWRPVKVNCRVVTER